jgi:hypothetical protein
MKGYGIAAAVLSSVIGAVTCGETSGESTAPTTITATGHGGSAGGGGGTAGMGGSTGGQGGLGGDQGGGGAGGCGVADPCQGHCENQTPDCAEAGTDCGGSCGVCAQTAILTDELDDPNGCSSGCTRSLVGAGQWTGGGWIPRAWGDRLVYDFGAPVSCGYAQIVVDNFSPLTQVTPNDVEGVYALFAGIHDAPEVDHCQSRTQLNLLTGPCFACPDPEQAHHLKLIGGLVGPVNPTDCTKACDWFDLYSPDTWAWDAPATFTFELRWNLHRFSGWVNGALEFDQELPSYPNTCGGLPSNCWPTEKLPELRYLYVGQTPSCTASLTAGADGPIFTHVEAVATLCTDGW